MEFKGTKGKWTTTYDEFDGYGVRLVEKGWSFGKVYIAQNISQGEDNGYADALLISKAPEMLEAMQEFCERVERGEVRSSKTYEKFKSIIKEATTV